MRNIKISIPSLGERDDPMEMGRGEVNFFPWRLTYGSGMKREGEKVLASKPIYTPHGSKGSADFYIFLTKKFNFQQTFYTDFHKTRFYQF